MLSFFARCLLVGTSLAPVLFVVAVSQFERGVPYTSWRWPLVICLSLVGLCKFLLWVGARVPEAFSIEIKAIDQKDHEIVVFLFIYLLPLMRSDVPTVFNSWMTGATVLMIVILSIVHARAFSFNPIMGLVFRYRFYSIRTKRGVPSLLISKDSAQMERLTVTRLAPDIYLRSERMND